MKTVIMIIFTIFFFYQGVNNPITPVFTDFESA